MGQFSPGGRIPNGCAELDNSVQVVMKPSLLLGSIASWLQAGHVLLLLLSLSLHSAIVSAQKNAVRSRGAHINIIQDTGGWQSKLPQHLQRNCSHWHVCLKPPPDFLLHQSWMRETSARTQLPVRSQTTLSLPGSWSARVRAEPSQPLSAASSSIPSLLQRQKDSRTPFCQWGGWRQNRELTVELQMLLLPPWQSQHLKHKVCSMARSFAESNFCCYFPPRSCQKKLP